MENANVILFYHSKNSLYRYTILFYSIFTSQNSIFIKILFFNLSLLLLSNRHFFSRFQRLHHHQSPHHTSTSTAPPSSITTPLPKCFSPTASASHHTHYTIRKPKPISIGPQPLMNAEELMNPDTADQPRSQQEKKKKKSPDQPRSKPRHRRVDQPKSTTKIPPEQNPNTADQPRSQQEKKKKPISSTIKTQKPPLLDQRFLHR